MGTRGAKTRVGVATRINARRLGRQLALIAALAALVVTVAGGVVFSSPASAAQIVNGCTIVPDPTPTNRTNCPNKNLSGANLAGLDLRFANFSGSNLKGASLENSNLRQANLRNVNLKGAHLGGATLVGAIVSGANLRAFFAATVMPNGSVNSSGATITVSPATATVANGLTQPFTATATYSDGTTVLLANNVTWSSLNNQVATVSSTGVAKGVVPNVPYNLANFPKAATITAAAGSAAGTASLTVGPPNLTSIAVTPANPAVVVGNTQQFGATGTYSDASTTPLPLVAWSSDTPSVATVDNAGLATAVAAGTTTITASSGPVSGSTALTVVDPVVITTESLPQGVQGSPYSQSLVSTGGVPPHDWSVSTGALPPGLTLSPTGAISGTPTGAGTFNFTVRAADAGPPAQFTTRALSLQISPPLGITTSSLPGGLTGVGYSQTLAAGGGIAPYTWLVTQGSLPNGLSLNAGTGQITGTPTAAGTSTFTVQVTDSQSPPRSVTKALTINVAVPLTSTSSTLFGDLLVGNALESFTPLSVSGGTPAYTWAVAAGSLPPGLNLNATTGAISGTPTTDGAFTFTIEASDSGVPPQKATRSVTLKVVGPLSISTTSLPDGQVAGLLGCFPAPCYSATLSGTGGGGPPYGWSLAAGSSLPPGLTLNEIAGVISGNPTTAGTFAFTVELARFGQPFPPVSKALSIKIVPAPPEFGFGFVNNAVTGSPYSFTPPLIGGASPFIWSITQGGLPAGLSLNSATGEISGTPTTAGTSNFTLTVVDSLGRLATRSLSINVVTPVTITTTSLPQADLGDSFYDATLAAAGGQPDYGWSVVAGNLPPGLTLNGATGHITGSASVSGTFVFTVQAKDFGFPNAQTATKELSITAFGITTGSLPGATQGSAYQAQARASGGTPPYLFLGVMPPGLGLNLNTGLISGTPTTAGTFTFTLTVCAPLSKCLLNQPGVLVAKRQFILTVAEGVAPLSITTTSLPSAHQFAPYSEYVGATGGTGPYTWSIIAGELPPGMLLDGATGEIHNAPGVAAATYNFTVQVRDSGSPQLTATRALSITVDSCFFCGGPL